MLKSHSVSWSGLLFLFSSIDFFCFYPFMCVCMCVTVRVCVFVCLCVCYVCISFMCQEEWLGMCMSCVTGSTSKFNVKNHLASKILCPSSVVGITRHCFAYLAFVWLLRTQTLIVMLKMSWGGGSLVTTQ